MWPLLTYPVRGSCRNPTANAPIVYRLVRKTFNLADGVQLSVGVRTERGAASQLAICSFDVVS